MDGDEVRIARNESRRRDVNEAIEEGRRDRGGPVGFVCECGQLGCTAVLEMTLGDYDAARRHPRRFVVATGHEQPQVETVVGGHGAWLLVEKQGLAGTVAESLR
ncbi:MAG TPA: hypothetical protein VIL49_01185 [Capillimicrobium sp.]|jgi:hypothetical protein